VNQFTKYLKILSLFVLLLSIPITSPAQDEREKKVRQDLDNKKITNQDQLRSELIKRHRAGQTKETRKRIKRSKREAKRRKQGKSPVPWWERIFRSNKRKKKRKKRT
jgi:hypothetical protein